MGRYTQRRRAASGPSPAAPPAPPTLTVVAVFASIGTEAVVQFSGPIVLDTGVTPDAAFLFDGETPGTVALDSANSARISGLTTFTLGDPWAVAMQPNWLVTPLVVPASGNA